MRMKESVIFQTDKMLTDMGDKISDDEKTTLQGEVDNLKNVSVPIHSDTMNASDVEQLKFATEAYTKVLHGFSAKQYHPNAAPDRLEEAHKEPDDYEPDHSET